LLLAVAGMVAFIAPLAGAAAEPHDSSSNSGFDPHAKRCAMVDDPRPDRPKFCEGDVGVQEPPTTTPPPTSPPPTSPPPTVGITSPPTAPAAPPPSFSVPVAGPDAGSDTDTAGASGALSELFGQPADVEEDAPVALRPTPAPDLPFGDPPLGGGLDDEGIPTGVYVVIALAAAAAAAMVVRGGLGRGSPFLTVPDDGQQTLPFE
jgi:hypothetical protein